MYLRNRLSKYSEKNNSSEEQKNYLESDHLNNRVKLIHSGNWPSSERGRSHISRHRVKCMEYFGLKYFKIIAQRINLFSNFREEQSLGLGIFWCWSRASQVKFYEHSVTVSIFRFYLVLYLSGGDAERKTFIDERGRSRSERNCNT